MRTPKLGLAASILLVACGTPGDAAPVDDTAAPEQAVTTSEQEVATGQEAVTRRVPQFENEHVEVWKSIIMPNQPLSMHRHDNPRAIIALKGGTLRVVSDAGDEHDMTWETGSAYWLEADTPGELHGDVNQGDEPVEVIVVQLKNVGGH